MSQYLVSIPKSCTNVPQHRKVAVTEDQDGFPMCDLQDKECQNSGWRKHKKTCGRYASKECKDCVEQLINGAKK